MFSKSWIFGLLLLIISTLVRAAYDLTTELVPLGELQVRLDYNLARLGGAPPKQRNKGDIRSVVFTSHLEFTQDVSAFTNGQLVQMAFNGYDDMLVELGRYGFSKYAKPSVMTVVAVGKEIYMATSQKGSGAFINTFPDSPVIKSLVLCQAGFHDTTATHINEAKCGEIMSTHSFFRKNPTATTMKGLGGRVVSVEMPTGSLQIKEPCGTREANIWGCNLFVENQGLTPVPKGTPAEAYQLNGVAGEATINQISLCT